MVVQLWLVEDRWGLELDKLASSKSSTRGDEEGSRGWERRNERNGRVGEKFDDLSKILSAMCGTLDARRSKCKFFGQDERQE